MDTGLNFIEFAIRGFDIAIEHRGADEMTDAGGRRVAPAGVSVYNPAFDVTPAALVTAIITERGVATPPFNRTRRALRTAS